MAVPFIIGGLAVAAGLFGAKKGYDAKTNYDTAERVVRNARREFEEAKEALEQQRNSTNARLGDLGSLRLTVESEQLGRFVATAREVNQVSRSALQLSSTQLDVNAPEFQQIEIGSYEATDLLKDGISAVSTGVLTAVGASGLATSIGVASTGTAIGTLSGVAATNATLAWLGGGSLATGGFGIAGGTAVLGGAIAGPAIAIMGYAAARKSEKALTAAHEQAGEIDIAAAQAHSGVTVLKAIQVRTLEIETTTRALSSRFESVLKDVERIVSTRKQTLQALTEQSQAAKIAYRKKNALVRFWHWLTRSVPDFNFADPLSFASFEEHEQAAYMKMISMGMTLHALLKVPVLDDSGSASSEGSEVMQAASGFLEGR